jgi:hypothetical protein
MATALEGGERSASRHGRSLPPGKNRYPLYRRLGGPQGRAGQVRKISPPTGIRSPDCPARSQSLYRLRYPGKARHHKKKKCRFNHSTHNVLQHRLLSYLLTISCHKTHLQRHKFQIKKQRIPQVC